jgi:hypothetical protein
MAITPLPGAVQPQFANSTVGSLFRSVENRQPVATNQIVKKGSLVSFGYSMWVHDPYPLVIVTDLSQGTRLRGVNLHYLTFPYIKTLLRTGAGNMGFSYLNIKADPYIVGAFRSYKWQGIRQVKMLDSDFLLTVMATVRSFDPSQVAAIRQAVQEQISREVNPRAPVPVSTVAPTPPTAAPVVPTVPTVPTVPDSAETV